MNLFEKHMLKNRIVLAFALVSALAFSACSSAPKTPEDFGEAVFEAIKNHSEKDLKALYLTEDEFSDIIDRSNLSEEGKNQERGRAIGLDKSMEKLAIETFEGLERLSNNYSIDWSKVNFKKVDVYRAEHMGIQGAHFMDVYFDYNGFEYALHIYDCWETENGWKTFKEISLSAVAKN
jgi:hypothetical protein